VSRGTNSWSPMGFVIFGTEPLLPAKLEQHIVNALPNQELNIDSFEDYEDALDFCKENANVGVIIIHENSEPHKIEEVFSQLARPYKASGWPVIGCIVRNSNTLESITALKAMRTHPEIREYCSESDLENPHIAQVIFDKLWSEYVRLVEQDLIPTALQDSLAAVVATQQKVADKVFYDRISEILSQPLNLSWRDRFRLRWHYLIREVDRISPAVLTPHQALHKLVLLSSSSADLSKLSLLEITTAKAPLIDRVEAVCDKLVAAGGAENLDALLKEARTESKPGRPGLLRHLADQSNAILSIFDDTYQLAAQNSSARKISS